MHTKTKIKIDTSFGLMEAFQVLSDDGDKPMAVIVFDQILDFLGIDDYEYDAAYAVVSQFRQENGMYHYARPLEEVSGDEGIALALEAGCKVLILEAY
jgi:hypothetical protein